MLRNFALSLSCIVLTLHSTLHAEPPKKYAHLKPYLFKQLAQNPRLANAFQEALKKSEDPNTTFEDLDNTFEENLKNADGRMDLAKDSSNFSIMDEAARRGHDLAGTVLDHFDVKDVDLGDPKASNVNKFLSNAKTANLAFTVGTGVADMFLAGPAQDNAQVEVSRDLDAAELLDLDALSDGVLEKIENSQAFRSFMDQTPRRIMGFGPSEKIEVLDQRFSDVGVQKTLIQLAKEIREKPVASGPVTLSKESEERLAQIFQKISQKELEKQNKIKQASKEGIAAEQKTPAPQPPSTSKKAQDLEAKRAKLEKEAEEKRLRAWFEKNESIRNELSQRAQEAEIELALSTASLLIRDPAKAQKVRKATKLTLQSYRLVNQVLNESKLAKKIRSGSGLSPDEVKKIFGKAADLKDIDAKQIQAFMKTLNTQRLVSALNTAQLAMNAVQFVMSLFGGQQSDLAIILKALRAMEDRLTTEIRAIGLMIQELRYEMSTEFSVQDKKLDALMKQLTLQFDMLNDRMDRLSVADRSFSQQLQNISRQIDRISIDIGNQLDDVYRRLTAVDMRKVIEHQSKAVSADEIERAAGSLVTMATTGARDHLVFAPALESAKSQEEVQDYFKVDSPSTRNLEALGYWLSDAQSNGQLETLISNIRLQHPFFGSDRAPVNLDEWDVATTIFLKMLSARTQERRHIAVEEFEKMIRYGVFSLEFLKSFDEPRHLKKLGNAYAESLTKLMTGLQQYLNNRVIEDWPKLARLDSDQIRSIVLPTVSVSDRSSELKNREFSTSNSPLFDVLAKRFGKTAAVQAGNLVAEISIKLETERQGDLKPITPKKGDYILAADAVFLRDWEKIRNKHWAKSVTAFKKGQKESKSSDGDPGVNIPDSFTYKESVLPEYPTYMMQEFVRPAIIQLTLVGRGNQSGGVATPLVSLTWTNYSVVTRREARSRTFDLKAAVDALSQSYNSIETIYGAEIRAHKEEAVKDLRAFGKEIKTAHEKKGGHISKRPFTDEIHFAERGSLDPLLINGIENDLASSVFQKELMRSLTEGDDDSKSKDKKGKAKDSKATDLKITISKDGIEAWNKMANSALLSKRKDIVEEVISGSIVDNQLKAQIQNVDIFARMISTYRDLVLGGDLASLDVLKASELLKAANTEVGFSEVIKQQSEKLEALHAFIEQGGTSTEPRVNTRLILRDLCAHYRLQLEMLRADQPQIIGRPQVTQTIGACEMLVDG